MGTLAAMVKHPEDFYALLKLKMAVRSAEKKIPPQPHWGFCYSMLHKVSRSFALVIQQLGPDLRDAVRRSSPNLDLLRHFALGMGESLSVCACTWFFVDSGGVD